MFLSFPATVIDAVSTSLLLNALERKPRASCCLTSAAKCKLEIKKNGEKRKQWEAPLARSGIPDSRRKCSSPFPGEVEKKVYPRCQLLLTSVWIQKIISHEKDLFERQQNRQQSQRSYKEE